MTAQIASFFDAATGTISHIVYDKPGGYAAVVDPVLDFDFRSGRISRAGADRLLAFLAEQRLTLQWILETHAHADHLSAAPYLKRQAGGRVAVGARIVEVQAIFRRVFNLEPAFRCDGSQFDHLFQDGETFRIGELEARVIALPGHTPADVGYRVEDAVFVGDTLFMPDVGTARCDFPGGDAAQLYRSIRKLLALPDATRLLLCHDYPPAGREPAWCATVAEQRAANLHARDSVDEAAFVAMRQARDATLAAPQLLLPSIQVNIRAGQLPPAEDNGVRYLKLPLDAL
ncbi:MBL fold metallo-hydrolase [Chromobacterium phragmitis]|uniref:MBL fold metallo-hydrolase n=1 Tax=Chromobacterium phragmitis TaxID=2202141 RepID=A0A344UJI9_9NEIS|nr:MBL fold metallo-hydrolase [Chromobacterium phragmitis]AXE30046.1 MBL fold metallo-hydrolase [Chromobacterium phragmitis]AXE35437.1 MBL fold metallo-hydrolase [Chromobacterium phragmitis]